jgi:prepilin-type processing-associated H-X9-DG protein
MCPAAEPNRRIEMMNVSNVLTGTWGLAGDYFGPNSVQAPWWPAEITNNTNTALHDNIRRELREIIDGTSCTLLISEQSGRPAYYIGRVKQPANQGTWWGCWAAYQVHQYQSFQGDGITTPGTCVVNCNNAQTPYSFHNGGVNAVFVDGSVHYIFENIDRDTLFQLVLRNDGMNIDTSKFN